MNQPLESTISSFAAANRASPSDRHVENAHIWHSGPGSISFRLPRCTDFRFTIPITRARFRQRKKRRTRTGDTSFRDFSPANPALIPICPILPGKVRITAA